MHMMNELISVPVAAGTLAVSAGWIAVISRKLHKTLKNADYALMGVLGAFVFAAQMVNIQLPLMPGTSCHFVGAVMLAIIFGPHVGAIVLSSVVVVQCLIFQDGGILALGCNILNMAIIPGYTGYFIYRLIANENPGRLRFYLAVIAACITGLMAGAAMVPLQAEISGVLSIPLSGFMFTMLGVHFLAGIVEGLITAAVLAYIMEVRPAILMPQPENSRQAMSMRGVYISMVLLTLIAGGMLSLAASDKPDGLEWSYAERPDNPDFEPVVKNDSKLIENVDRLHGEYAPMPDYTIRASSASETASGAWTSFAGVAGAFVTMLLVWLAAKLIRSDAKEHSLAG
jgi:cobalt/nickel transport system permease protein